MLAFFRVWGKDKKAEPKLCLNSLSYCEVLLFLVNTAVAVGKPNYVILTKVCA